VSLDTTQHLLESFFSSTHHVLFYSLQGHRSHMLFVDIPHSVSDCPLKSWNNVAHLLRMWDLLC